MIRLLILDDDRDFCQLLAIRTKHEPYPKFIVQTASTIEEARELVADAIEPFDIFLIDVQLEAGLDGIEVMQELHRVSPSTDVIIMTGGFNPNTALRAYRAGASRCLAKQSAIAEIVLTLRSMYEKRRTQNERQSLSILTEVASETLRRRSVSDVSQLIVNCAIRLGFERARLWLLDESQQVLVGLSQKGTEGLADFSHARIPLDHSVYCQQALEQRELSFFYGLELGQGYLPTHYGAQGFLPPVGEWVNIPLWASSGCLGMLTLDHANSPISLRPVQRDFLRLFGKQVTVYLERALSFEQEQRERQEIEVLNQISRHIASRAAVADLETLLEEIRSQINALIDVDNFTVVLLNQEAGRLEYCLEYENGQPQAQKWSSLEEHPLISHLIERNEALFAPEGTEQYRGQHGIALKGRPSKSWISAPLSVNERAIGLLVLDDNEKDNAYGAEDLRLLQRIASQVAGVIHVVRTRESERTIQQQLDILHRASEILMKLAEEKEAWMWHFTLTAATANYGLGFNRAFLFLRTEDGRDLRWVLGIGHFDKPSAEKDWLADVRDGLSQKQYLRQLRADELHRSPIEVQSQQQRAIFSLDEAGSAFNYVLGEAERHIVPASRATYEMPRQFVARFGKTDYALIPLRAGKQVLGLLVVDNIFTQDPLRPLTLDYLDTFLGQAALTYQILKQQRLQDRLIELNYSVLADMHQLPLQEILSQICQATQEVTGADSVIICPFKPNQEPYEYDMAHMASVELLTEFNPSAKLRLRGVRAHILRMNQLVINHVSEYPPRFDGQELANHSFLKREGIEAFIGVRVHDVDNDDLCGVLYLNYREPQSFTAQMKRYAESFASLAAVAIRNARTYHTEQLLRQSAEEGKLEREQELIRLQVVSQEALTPQADEPRVIKTLLRAAEELLNVPDVRVQVLLRDWQIRNGAKGNPQEIRRNYWINDNGLLKEEEHIYRGLIDEILRKKRHQLVKNVTLTRSPYCQNESMHSKLAALISSHTEITGILKATAPAPAAFTDTHRQIFERLVGVGSLALDNLRRQKHLYDVFRATKAVTGVSDLKPTWDAITDALFDVAPGLSALAIWYIEPEEQQLKLGAYYGIRDEAAWKDMSNEEIDVVRRVMNANPDKGIWAENATIFGSPLMRRKKIKSAAAFPLFANDEKVGAMFLYYRLRHKFTDEEKGIFPILAASVAASILNAARLEAVRCERRRFQAAAAITEKVGTSLDLDDTLQKVMTVLREQLFPETNICVMMYQEQEQALTFTNASKEFYKIDNPVVLYRRYVSQNKSKQTYDAFASKSGFFQLLLNQPSIATRVAKAALKSKLVEVENVPDVRSDPDYLAGITSTRSQISISLMGSKNQLLGVLTLESPKVNRFDAEDESLFLHVGRKISLAMEHVYQNAKLRFHTTVAAATSWAAEIAHHIASQMGLIRDRLEWLLEDESFSQLGLGYIEEIEQSLSRLDAPLNSMRALQSRRAERLVFDQWVKETICEIIAEKQKTKQTKVIFELNCVRLTIHVSPMGLGNAIRYLINNALEQIGGQALGYLLIKSRILDKAEKIEVQIEDSGSGVDETIRHTLLQSPSSTKNRIGHGFGLLFARHLIEQMGGTLYLIQPSKLSGACFAFTLPISKTD